MPQSGLQRTHVIGSSVAVDSVSDAIEKSLSQPSVEEDESSSSGGNGRGKNKGPTW